MTDELVGRDRVRPLRLHRRELRQPGHGRPHRRVGRDGRRARGDRRAASAASPTPSSASRRPIRQVPAPRCSSPPTTATPTSCATPTGNPVTAHSLNPVPLLVAGPVRPRADARATASSPTSRRRSSSSPGCRAGTGMTGRSLLDVARGAVAARTSATIRDRHPPEVNPPVNPILAIGQILLSIALIAAILLQARGTGLSGTFGGDSAVYRSRRGIERRLWQFTIVLLVLFILFALVAFVIVPPTASRSGRTQSGPTSLDPPHNHMPITRRDNAVVVVLVLSLVVLGGVIAMPAPAPSRGDARADARGHAAAPGHLPRGRRRRPRRDHAGRGAHAVRAHARRADLQRPRPARSRQHLRARPRRVVDDRRQGQDLDVQDPRRRDLAGRRAGDGARTSCTPSRRSRIPRRRARWPAPGRTSRRPPSTRKTVELTVATPIAGFLAATTQPLLPAHLLVGRAARGPRHEPVRQGAGGHRAVFATELDDTHALLTPVALMERPGGDVPFGAHAAGGLPGHAGSRPRRPSSPSRTSSASSSTSSRTTRPPPRHSAPARSTGSRDCLRPSRRRWPPTPP